MYCRLMEGKADAKSKRSTHGEAHGASFPGWSCGRRRGRIGGAADAQRRMVGALGAVLGVWPCGRGRGGVLWDSRCLRISWVVRRANVHALCRRSPPGPRRCLVRRARHLDVPLWPAPCPVSCGLSVVVSRTRRRRRRVGRRPSGAGSPGGVVRLCRLPRRRAPACSVGARCRPSASASRYVGRHSQAAGGRSHEMSMVSSVAPRSALDGGSRRGGWSRRRCASSRPPVASGGSSGRAHRGAWAAPALHRRGYCRRSASLGVAQVAACCEGLCLAGRRRVRSRGVGVLLGEVARRRFSCRGRRAPSPGAGASASLGASGRSSWHLWCRRGSRRRDVVPLGGVGMRWRASAYSWRRGDHVTSVVWVVCMGAPRRRCVACRSGLPQPRY